MSKTFIIILCLIAVIVGVQFFSLNNASDDLGNYEKALAECGIPIGSSFTDAELLEAQKCACENGDKVSCQFVSLQGNDN